MAVFHYCEDCERSSAIHIQEWIDVIIGWIVPASRPLPYWIENTFNKGLIRVLSWLRLAHVRYDYTLDELSPRVGFFIEAARLHGITCGVVELLGRMSEHIVLTHNGKMYHFEAYPTGAHFDGPHAHLANDKLRSKQHLQAGGFSTPRGRMYYFWQKEKAVREAIDQLGFPLVVKPVHGTFSRHVTTNIRNKQELRAAIEHALTYQPIYIVEQYIEYGSVLRVMVINFKAVAAVLQLPPQVRGDGIHTIRELVLEENIRRNLTRKEKSHAGTPEPLVISPLFIADEDCIPEAGHRSVINAPYTRYGAEATPLDTDVHESIILVSEQAATHFQVHCTGIDMIVENPAPLHATPRLSILELNSLPNYEMHGNDAQKIGRLLYGSAQSLYMS